MKYTLLFVAILALTAFGFRMKTKQEGNPLQDWIQANQEYVDCAVACLNSDNFVSAAECDVACAQAWGERSVGDISAAAQASTQQVLAFWENLLGSFGGARRR